MRNKMTDIEKFLARRNEIVTCETCERSGSRYSQNVQMFYGEGERYYGSPLRQGMGSIIVQGLSCGSSVRTQAQAKVSVLSATYVPAEMANRPLRVNEMP
jgi:hypothetical protein